MRWRRRGGPAAWWRRARLGPLGVGEGVDAVEVAGRGRFTVVAAAQLGHRRTSWPTVGVGFGITLPISGATVGATGLHSGQSRRTQLNRKPRSGGWCRTGADPSGPGGGRYGIRTHGDPEATTAFEAAPFVRSGNLPPERLADLPILPELGRTADASNGYGQVRAVPQPRWHQRSRHAPTDLTAWRSPWLSWLRDVRGCSDNTVAGYTTMLTAWLDYARDVRPARSRSAHH